MQLLILDVAAAATPTTAKTAEIIWTRMAIEVGMANDQKDILAERGLDPPTAMLN